MVQTAVTQPTAQATSTEQHQHQHHPPEDGAALLKGILMRGLPDNQKTTPRRSQDVSRDADYNDDDICR